jgi:hypothetical protein
LHEVIRNLNAKHGLTYEQLKLSGLINEYEKEETNKFIFELRNALMNLDLCFNIKEVKKSGNIYDKDNFVFKTHTILWSYAYNLLDGCANLTGIRDNPELYTKFLSIVHGSYLESIIFKEAFVKYGDAYDKYYPEDLFGLDFGYNYQVKTASNIYYVGYNYGPNLHYEIDMVVEFNDVVYLCEIKLSDKCLPYFQAKYLMTSDCYDDYYEKSKKIIPYNYNKECISHYGNNKKIILCVLYTGGNKDILLKDGNIIHYQNIEDFLIQGFNDYRETPECAEETNLF